jgi:hypothetical protein
MSDYRVLRINVEMEPTEVISINGQAVGEGPLEEIDHLPLNPYVDRLVNEGYRVVSTSPGVVILRRPKGY